MQLATDEKPDFSGQYVLNRQASLLSPGAAAVQSGVLSIEHREPRVRFHLKFAFEGRTLEFDFERVSDGREVTDSREGTSISSLHWEDRALVFLDRTRTTDSEVTMSWRYEFLAGDRLRAVEQIRGAGRDQDNVWMFERN